MCIIVRVSSMYAHIYMYIEMYVLLYNRITKLNMTSWYRGFLCKRYAEHTLHITTLPIHNTNIIK